ncbi:hypothetical protein BGZ63DRAFT_446930 [Mariannaea sp. PMI_226]|nr:hypothetical protein BGZ63DRAFT_446930 [Mariannaea sp. PMI_226]
MDSNHYKRSRLRSRINSLPHLSSWRLLKPRRQAHLYGTSKKDIFTESQQLGDAQKPVEQKPLPNPDVTHHHKPILPYRRKSLGDAFQLIKAKWDNDRNSDSSQETNADRLLQSEDETSQVDSSSDIHLTSYIPVSKPDPPRLEIPSGFQHEGLERSSTFRALIEKAVDDINMKYGSNQFFPFKHCSLGSLHLKGRTAQLPSGRFCSNLKTAPGIQDSKPLTNDLNKKTGSLSTVSLCQSCGSSACCLQSIGRGIPIHQIDKILEQSIQLRDPRQPFTSSLKERIKPSQAEDDWSLSPV